MATGGVGDLASAPTDDCQRRASERCVLLRDDEASHEDYVSRYDAIVVRVTQLVDTITRLLAHRTTTRDFD